ncbi:hypothetical protein IMZ48_22475 [Candidatus Bathyarchaeota archaeon]|nr:hypothetical protein [Candidatus Bathyarchaeota archaeon]
MSYIEEINYSPQRRTSTPCRTSEPGPSSELPVVRQTARETQPTVAALVFVSMQASQHRVQERRHIACVHWTPPEPSPNYRQQ